MCIFSRSVEAVTNTSIFARIEYDVQYLVYSMRLVSREDVAMLLPVPITAKSDEKSVKFFNLEEYPRLFDDMDAGFILKGDNPPTLAATPGDSKSPALEVNRVGSYEASYVPSLRDFARLDPRFRLPAETWAGLPQFRDYGFVVFKFRKGASIIHPLAFSFPTRDTNRLYFPTVHIHDGKIHPRENFDHSLYCQPVGQAGSDLIFWRESLELAKEFVKTRKTEGIVSSKRHVYRSRIRGLHPNVDTWVTFAKNWRICT